MSTGAASLPRTGPAPKLVDGFPRCARCSGRLLLSYGAYTCVACGYEWEPGEHEAWPPPEGARDVAQHTRP